LIFSADFDLLIILPATALLVIVALWCHRSRPEAGHLGDSIATACLALAGFTVDMVRGGGRDWRMLFLNEISMDRFG
jgi:hypothetical protein